MSIPHEPIRHALAEGDPERALVLLQTHHDPDADWLRALATALLGDSVRSAVALRSAQRAGPLSEQALHDVASLYARALLDDRPEARALAPLAVAVHDELGALTPVDAVHLAWELCVRAATGAEQRGDPAGARAGQVLTLGALKWRMRRDDEAIALLRGAQDAAVAAREAEVVHGAALLLAEVQLSRGDATLADAIITHAGRQLSRLGGDPARLRQAWSTAVSARREDDASA